MSGADEGSEHPFEGDEAKLGRTADNDLVVKDAAASRSHARVFARGGKFFLEDLGSANGTRLNDAQVKAKSPKELRAGDTVSIGDFVVAFEPQGKKAESPSRTQELEDEEANHTLALSPEEMEARRAALARRAPARPARAVAPAPEAAAEPPSAETARPSAAKSRPSRGAMSKPSLAAVAPVPAAAEKPASEVVEAPAPLSAAERARVRRELSQSVGGKLQLAWQDLPKPARLVVGGVVSVIFLGALGSAAWFAIPHEAPRQLEPMTLQPNGPPIPESFGEGAEVTYRRPDMKTFTFATVSPTQLVGVVHFQAKNISKDEVVISLNGNEVGSVAPDTMDADSRELDFVLPAAQLKRSEENTLSFDNVRNPPEKEEWMIWNVWVEIIPVPEMSAAEAARQAKDQLARAQKFYELREIGAANLFSAWKTYRDAWLLLEATPNHDAALYTIARTRIREIRPELDQRCASMKVAFKKAVNQRPQDLFKARQIVGDIPSYFPTKEHPCFAYAQDLIRQLDDVSDQEYGQH